VPTTVVELTSNRLPELIRRLPAAVGEIVEETALELEATVKAGMASSMSPSSPGQYPGVDTGTLMNSIQTEPESDTVQVVYTNVEYAPYLEFGTVHMEPRPFLGQAASTVEPDFVVRLANLEKMLR
jgi:HK97 gp10 family phage protein